MLVVTLSRSREDAAVAGSMDESDVSTPSDQGSESSGSIESDEVPERLAVVVPRR
jgi:hypothetical protein